MQWQNNEYVTFISKETHVDIAQLPCPCGKHVIFYPSCLLIDASLNSSYFVFHSACECPYGYLLLTEHAGTRFHMMGTIPTIIHEYERMPWQEYKIDNGFFFKQAPSRDEIEAYFTKKRRMFHKVRLEKQAGGRIR